jgi:glycosyltransferase involved in cell wall biosynthesis
MMTSIFEGFPMTLLECEQMGCVPICWNSFPTVTEAIQHGKNGIVVDNNDRELFAKELLKLMNDEAKRLLMAESSIEYSKHFSQDNMVKEWEINLKAITSHEK